MEDDRKKGKEYYQVNLDMGRLFWIAFVLGLILIGIFVLGFYIGGGKGKEKKERVLLKLGASELFKRERAETVQKEEEGVQIEDLFESDLEAETRYIDIEGFGGEVSESMKLPQVKKTEQGITEMPAEVTGGIEKKVYTAPEKQPSLKAKPKYRPVGDYYIQVASFLKEENAENLAGRLRKNLYRVVIEKAVVNEKTYYRVRVGPFELKSVASNTMIAMKKRFNLEDPFVLKKGS